MSGETVSVVEVCGVAAAGSLVAARAVAGVVAGVAGAGLSAPGAALSAVGRRMEAHYARHQQHHAALVEWEAAAREVVDRNARLSVLAARPGGTPGLPPPLNLQGQSLEELTSWCAATDEALQEVERALLAEAAVAVSVVLDSVGGSVEAAGLLTAHSLGGQEGGGDSVAGAAPPPELVAACHRILGGLTADVPSDVRAEVLDAVARVQECTTPAHRQTWLAELRVRVRQANAVTARRREQARTAATMLQALAESTEERTAAVRAELEGVVAGHRELDPEVHRSALAACEEVRAARENAYVRDCLTRALERLGYEVEPGFDTFTAQGARLRLVRDQWQEHAVSVVLNDGEVRAMVVRTESAEGTDVERLDVEREQQWCADFEELRDHVAGDGLRLNVQRLVPPGERHVPVAARRQRPARRDEGKQERRR
ncbi:MAG: hypothetical protein ACRDTC_10565 [Pseudonocardiaceae bacterium]